MADEVVIQNPLPVVAPGGVRRASWGAIFGGAFVTVVLQFMFTLLGAGVGIATTRSQTLTPSQAWLTASGIWFLVTGLLSIWTGACVAGRLCGGPGRADGLLHGLVTWSVAMVALLALLSTTFGGALGGTTQLIAAAMGSANHPGQSELTLDANGAVAPAAPGHADLAPTGRTQEPQPAAAQPPQGFGQSLQWTVLWGFFALLLGLLAAAWGGWAGTASLARRAETVVETSA